MHGPSALLPYQNEALPPCGNNTRNIYHLDPTGLAHMRKWLDSMWTDALEAFAKEVESSKKESQ